jgi:transposase
MPVVSLDVHKNSCTYVAMHWDQILDGPKRIPTQRDALARLAGEFHDSVFVFEATAVSEWIHDVLKDAGVNVFVYKPYKRESRRDKSDPKDAIRGGMKYQVGELKEVHVPDHDVRPTRDQVRDRCFLAHVQTQFKNHIHGYLNQKDPARGRVPRDIEGSTVFTKRGREAVLRVFPELEASFEVYQELHRQLNAADNGLEKLASSLQPVQRMTSITGIGTITGLALYVEIVDPKRFPSAEAVVGYFGLDPVKDQSGDSEWDKHRISKEGRGYIRGLLVQAAWTHVTKCPESDISEKYYELAKKRGKQKAIVATARRLLRTAYTLWKEDRDFAINGPAVPGLAGAQAQA